MGITKAFSEYVERLVRKEELDDDMFDDGLDEEEEDFPEEDTFEPAPAAEREFDSPRKPKKYIPSGKPRRGGNVNIGTGLEVCVIKPVTIDEARSVTDTLLEERAVVLNLEGLDVEVAQRIIDFTSGSCYAIRGNLQKISNYIFIITPQSVEISGDFQSIFGAGNADVSTI